MQRVRSSCFAIAISLLLAAGAAAQDVMPLAQPTDALLQLKEVDWPELAKAAEVISVEWDFIAESFDKVGGPPTDQFQLAMKHNKLLLQKAAAEPNNQYSLELVDYVEEDLILKASFIREKSAGAVVTAATYSEVAVDVRTMKNGSEIDGYFIGFSPRYMAGGNPLVTFNNPTNPSKGSLAPGRYEMMAIQNGKVVQRQEVSVGILGQQGPIICLVP
ncbi:hypothetical protein [Nitratireductor sp. ZSWI3]|uniref:hypothetical protein n=1 Tax=Nitratireductor sp. ZSWI3 TaxID=2966359 RepID=UPI00215020E2|nr:hypothetical protein [Nitratireductor sp. ZSWI3]MCR4268153.1 hypothetical protein [Nitratireductor sp. ZSWI3]